MNVGGTHGRRYRNGHPARRSNAWWRRRNQERAADRLDEPPITSIPPAVYRSPPPIERGRAPNGAWLLFSYLQYAERLEKVYSDAIAARVRARAPPADDGRAAHERPVRHGDRSDVFQERWQASAGLRRPQRPGAHQVEAPFDDDRPDAVRSPVSASTGSLTSAP
jgi:hypothetical protein